RKPTQFVWDRPLLVKPTRSTRRGNPCPSCPAGTYTSTTRTDESSSILLLRAWLSIVTRLMEPIDPKNLRMFVTPVRSENSSAACGRCSRPNQALLLLWQCAATLALEFLMDSFIQLV